MVNGPVSNGARHTGQASQRHRAASRHERQKLWPQQVASIGSRNVSRQMGHCSARVSFASFMMGKEVMQTDCTSKKSRVSSNTFQ